MRRSVISALAAVAGFVATGFFCVASAQDAAGSLVYKAKRAYCGATLIGPDLVLTAAHCLYNPKTGAPIPLRDISFVSGSGAGGARVVAADIPKGFSISASRRQDAVTRDVAVLRLGRVIAAAPARVSDPQRERLGRGHSLTVRDNRADHRCPHTATIAKTVSVLGCALAKGASGSGVMARIDGEWVVVAVVSAAMQDATAATFASVSQNLSAPAVTAQLN